MVRYVPFEASREDHQGLVAGAYPQGFVDAMQAADIQCRHQPACLAGLCQTLGKQAEEAVALGQSGQLVMRCQVKRLVFEGAQGSHVLKGADQALFAGLGGALQVYDAFQVSLPQAELQVQALTVMAGYGEGGFQARPVLIAHQC